MACASPPGGIAILGVIKVSRLRRMTVMLFPSLCEGLAASLAKMQRPPMHCRPRLRISGNLRYQEPPMRALRRTADGDSPMMRLNVRLKLASDSYPSFAAISAIVCLPSRSSPAASCMRHWAT